MRLLADGADAARSPRARALLDAIDARLSRFRPGSRARAPQRRPARRRSRPRRCCAPRSAPRCGRPSGPAASSTRRCSATLERAGLRAARVADGRARRSRAALARRRRAPRAAARRGAAWRAVRSTTRAGTITRPPRPAARHRRHRRRASPPTCRRAARSPARAFVVDCGGDLRVAGARGARPFEVAVEHPLTGERRRDAARPRRRRRDVRARPRALWRGADGRPAHHLLDPATGAPGVDRPGRGHRARADARSQAEALAKAALLGGPAGARRAARRAAAACWSTTTGRSSASGRGAPCGSSTRPRAVAA